MSRGSSFVLIVVITVCAVALAVHSQRRDDAIPRAGELLFPGLIERVNDARAITATSGGERFTVELVDRRWVVREKSGYPAAPDTVHQLLVGAAGLERIEPKTANPELYGRIGLEDPVGDEAGSVRYVVVDAAGSELANLVVGDRRASRTTLEDSEIYVRVGDDPQSWLVEGKLPRASDVDGWLDEGIVAIDGARIRDVTVVHPDGERVVIEKARVDDVEYVLAGLPEGRELASPYGPGDIGRSFSSFELEDVRAGDLDDAGGEPGFEAAMRTYDGLVVRLATRLADDRTFGTFSATFDAAHAAEGAALVAEAGGDAADPAVPALLQAQEVQAEAERLAGRWSGWVYELPAYRASYFAKRLEDLLAPLEEDAPEESPPAPTAGDP